MIIDYIIPLVSCFFTDRFAQYWWFPLIALAFVCTVPCIVKRILR